MNIKFLTLTLILVIAIFIPTLLPSKQNYIDPLKLTGEYNKFDTKAEFNGNKLASSEVLEDIQINNKVLGTNDNIKRIEVDLTNQTLKAFEGDRKIHEFLISSGKWGKTPTGTFRIWGKFRYTKMEGGKKELNTYYYLPNVPYVMFFENEKVQAYKGFGIHGTYWHNNFGHPMSHGCINMKTEEAGIIYNWATPNLGDKKSGRATDDNPGTEIIIYGVAPKG